MSWVRRHWGWLLASLLVGAGVWFLAWPLWQLDRGYQAVRSEMTTLHSALVHYQMAAAARTTGRAVRTTAAMSRELSRVSYLHVLPVWGPVVGDLHNGLTALGAGLQAAQILETVAGPHWRSGLGRVMTQPRSLSSLLGDAVTASQALDAMRLTGLPPQLEPTLARLAPWAQVAKTLRPVLSQAAADAGVISHLLGAKGPQHYLLLFQNSGELRATGGFMTAYATLDVNHGAVHLSPVRNIYQLDAQVRYHPPASRILLDYLPVTYWHLRDANTSPDVPTTAAQIIRFYASIPGTPRLSGILFVNTWVVDALLQDVGPVSVSTPKGAVTVTAQNANYEMEYMAEREGLSNSKRKQFLGTMMKELEAKVLRPAGRTEALALWSTLGKSLQQKNILLWFANADAEQKLRDLGWAGAMDTHVTGDYLSVVDENLLGHKDNFFMHYTVTTSLSQVAGRWQETTSMHYVNTGVDNGWLVVPYQSWVRFYVPLGSQLIGWKGISDWSQTTVNADLQKTVFGGHVLLAGRTSSAAPPAQKTVSVSYWLPKGLVPRTLVIQKQPGIRDETVVVKRGVWQTRFPLNTDATVALPQ